MPEEVPSELLPHKDREPTSVELVAQDVATNIPAEAVREVAESLDAVALDGNIMRRMGELGVQVGSIGSVQVGRGFNFVTAKELLKLILKISPKVDDPIKGLEAARCVGYLAGQLNKLTASMKDKAATSTAAAPGPSRTKSFPHDAPVQMTQVIIQKDS